MSKENAYTATSNRHTQKSDRSHVRMCMCVCVYKWLLKNIEIRISLYILLYFILLIIHYIN